MQKRLLASLILLMSISLTSAFTIGDLFDQIQGENIFLVGIFLLVYVTVSLALKKVKLFQKKKEYGEVEVNKGATNVVSIVLALFASYGVHQLNLDWSYFFFSIGIDSGTIETIIGLISLVGLIILLIKIKQWFFIITGLLLILSGIFGNIYQAEGILIAGAIMILIGIIWWSRIRSKKKANLTEPITSSGKVPWYKWNKERDKRLAGNIKKGAKWAGKKAWEGTKWGWKKGRDIKAQIQQREKEFEDLMKEIEKDKSLFDNVCDYGHTDQINKEHLRLQKKYTDFYEAFKKKKSWLIDQAGKEYIQKALSQIERIKKYFEAQYNNKMQTKEKMQVAKEQQEIKKILKILEEKSREDRARFSKTITRKGDIESSYEELKNEWSNRIYNQYSHCEACVEIIKRTLDILGRMYTKAKRGESPEQKSTPKRLDILTKEARIFFESKVKQAKNPGFEASWAKFIGYLINKKDYGRSEKEIMQNLNVTKEDIIKVVQEIILEPLKKLQKQFAEQGVKEEQEKKEEAELEARVTEYIKNIKNEAKRFYEEIFPRIKSLEKKQDLEKIRKLLERQSMNIKDYLNDVKNTSGKKFYKKIDEAQKEIDELFRRLYKALEEQRKKIPEKVIQALKFFGINPTDANPKRIKKIYRKLAGEAHPDAGGTNEGFQELGEHYRILKEYYGIK